MIVNASQDTSVMLTKDARNSKSAIYFVLSTRTVRTVNVSVIQAIRKMKRQVAQKCSCGKSRNKILLSKGNMDCSAINDLYAIDDLYVCVEYMTTYSKLPRWYLGKK